MLRVSTDKNELDIAMVHRYLAEESAWARGIPLATVVRSIENSLCFGGYLGEKQVAFARVVSDYATFANLVDVFVASDHRGQGYGKKVMAEVVLHPQLQGLRRFTLATADAHGLYAQFGFVPLHRPESFMERYAPDIYQRVT